jgi:hypothetical protein
MSGNLWWQSELQIRRHPITLFQLAVFALHHEPWPYSITLLTGAYLLDRHVRRFESVDRWLSELWKVVRFAKKHSACAYERIDLAEVFSKDVVSRYRTQLMTEGKIRTENQLRSLLRLQPFGELLSQRTRIHVVRRGSAREKPGPTAFMTDLGGFIFVTEGPKDIVGLQRFFLLHELGHLSQFSTYTKGAGRRFAFLLSAPLGGSASDICPEHHSPVQRLVNFSVEHICAGYQAFPRHILVFCSRSR